MEQSYIEVKRNSLVDEISGGAVVRAHNWLHEFANDAADVEVASISTEAAELVDTSVEALSFCPVIEVSHKEEAETPEPAEIKVDTANATASNTINYTSGNDVVIISKNTSGAIYSTLDGADIVQVQGDNNTVKAGNGDDVIRVTAGSGNGHVIYGDAGNDIITVAGGAGHTLNGGAGNDRYVINNLVAGGKYIIDQTTAAQGDRDSLSLTKLDSDAITMNLSGSDLLLTHKNGATITIKGWSTNPLTILKLKDETSNTAEVNANAKTVAPSVLSLNNISRFDAVGVMHAFMNSLDNTVQKGFVAVNEAVNACSMGMYSSLDNLVDAFINDCVNHSGSTTAERKAFLKQYCDVDLDNDDTGAITGSDAGGSFVKTAASVVKEASNVSINDFVYDYSNFKTVSAIDVSGLASYKSVNYNEKKDFYGATVDGVTFYWSESDWDNLGVDTEICKQIVGGVINAWADAAFDLIDESYGLRLDGANSTLQRLDDGTVGIQLQLQNTSSSSIASVASSRFYDYANTNITTKTFEVMSINLKYYKNGMTDVNGNSSSASAGYLDRTIAHELTHATMAANINSFANLPTFIKEGTAELTHGIDDERTSSILTLVNTGYKATSTSNGVSTTLDLEGLLRKVFNLTSTSYSYSTYTYAGGYLLMRYMAKNVSDYVNGSSAMLSETDALAELHKAEQGFSYNDGSVSSNIVDYSSNSSESLKIFGNC